MGTPEVSPDVLPRGKLPHLPRAGSPRTGSKNVRGCPLVVISRDGIWGLPPRSAGVEFQDETALGSLGSLMAGCHPGAHLGGRPRG